MKQASLQILAKHSNNLVCLVCTHCPNIVNDTNCGWRAKDGLFLGQCATSLNLDHYKHERISWKLWTQLIEKIILVDLKECKELKK